MMNRAELRQQAEARLRNITAAMEAMSPADIKRLAHELQVHQVELELQNEELRMTQTQLEASRKRYADLYDQAPVGYCTLTKEGGLIEANQTLADLLDMAKEDLIGTRFYNFLPEAKHDQFFVYLRTIFNTDARQTCEILIRKHGGTEFSAYLESRAWYNAAEPRYCRTTITDITERKHMEDQIRRSLQEKELLLREIHHRTRNNMQVIQSLLNLEAQYLDDQRALQAFQEIRDRIRAMAIVHERLYESDLTTVDLADHIRRLAPMLVKNYQIGSGQIAVQIDAEPVLVTIDTAVPFGILLNELLTNAVKYAFPDGRDGNIQVTLRETIEEQIELRVHDDGIGFPAEFDLKHPPSLGFQLITLLAEHQLKGTLQLHTRARGTEIMIRFQRPRYKNRIQEAITTE